MWLLGVFVFCDIRHRVDGVQVPPLFISLFQDPQRTFEEFVVLLVALQD